MATRGKLIVITAPVTETIDHAGYFIQMAIASLPIWLEKILDSKYPKWRDLERDVDGSAKYMPAGVRTVEAALLREYRAEDIACCYPDDLENFIGPDTRVVAVSTHNPLGVTFARRSLHLDFRLVQTANQLALLAADVRPHPFKPAPGKLQSDRGRLRRLADHANRQHGYAGRGLRGGRTR